MSMRECVCARDKGKRGVLSCVEMRGKTNILRHVPSHTFPHWFGLFKSCCQCCLSASLSLCLGLRELLSTFWTHRQTAVGGSNLIRNPDSNQKVSSRREDCYHLLVDNFPCEMLLYLNILVLLLLQPALSSPVPLTTPSRRCPTCKSKTSQSQPSLDLNTTSLAVGEPCGVYTVSCAHGLRCAPPEDEPRPLRALLEGRGVCSNGSGSSPTENIGTAGKVHTLFLEDDVHD